MSLEGPGKLMHYEGPRMLIYISKVVAADSAFPFGRGDKLWIRVDSKNERIIISRKNPRKK